MAVRTTVAALVSRISRLTVAASVPSGSTSIPLQCARRVHTQTSPLLFHASTQLWSAPMKKKKKMDPAVLLARENKRRKKIERQMRRLEKFGRRLKPIEEIEDDLKIQRELQMRRREVVEMPMEESERRVLLHKEWARCKMREHKQESHAWTRMVNAQQVALHQLRFESEELYQMAVQRDETLIPLEFRGPTITPPLQNYEAPDGEYTDTTKTYD